MGEIFRQERPQEDLPWTGERLVQGIGGTIENEHFHRYFLARDLCRGRDVLDVASGEGYGSALLAQSALSVLGIEIDPVAVRHAADAYPADNLRFVEGSATSLPAGDASVDVVVSFETLEHFFDHDAFLGEVRRVLRPDGLLVLSTPDTDVYSGPSSTPNLFHVRELTTGQFARLVGAHFPNVSLLRQRVMIGSAIVSDGAADPTSGQAAASGAGQGDRPLIYEQRAPRTFESHRRLPRAPYLLALASSGRLPAVGTSLFIRSDDLNAPAAEMQAELDRLRAVEVRAISQATSIGELTDAMAAARAEIDRLNQELAAQKEEFERLRGVEEASRSHAPAIRQIETDFSETRLALEQARAAVVEAHASEQAAAGLARIATYDAEGLRTRCLTAEMVSRQQTLALTRLSRQLAASLAAPSAGSAAASHDTGLLELAGQERIEVERERDALRDQLGDMLAERNRIQAKADDYVQAYDAASRMIVPIWMRRLVPSSIRSVRRERTSRSVPALTHEGGE